VQAPLIVFDHRAKTVAIIATAPGIDPRLDEVLARQREQMATSGPSAGK
jgi:hypothetical protein